MISFAFPIAQLIAQLIVLAGTSKKTHGQHRLDDDHSTLSRQRDLAVGSDYVFHQSSDGKTSAALRH